MTINSIYRSASVIVPLAEVQHIELASLGLIVVMSSTRWDHDNDTWGNNLWIGADEADAFTAAWTAYREAIEAPQVEFVTREEAATRRP